MELNPQRDELRDTGGVARQTSDAVDRDRVAFTELPVVDLRRWQGAAADREAFAAEVADICHRVGFFVVVEHSIDGSFIDSIFEMMHDLFGLPDAEKSAIDKRRSRHFRGWEAVGTEFTNNRPDIREQVDLWSERPARGPDVQPAYLRLLGPNQWFRDDVLPGSAALMRRWFTEMGALADALLGVLSVGLELDEKYLATMFGDEPMSLTKLIRYPPTPPGGAGVNAHHDTGFLTLLAPGPTPGLQIENQAGEWIPAPSIPGGLIVNLGEMLQSLTGNYFTATPHRVITDDVRYSAAYFHGPSLDTSLTPLPLGDRFHQAVAASAHHAGAGFMATKAETDAGVGDMQSEHHAAVYGEQLWNYFARSYPELVTAHYPGDT
ncbi:MAG: 2-oxoglutarate and iron-dependent oxygenase domain-containing protein [Actinomycetota bacterium]